jgi:PBP1b-binding outer membrane lipoprotein LpoB
MRRAFIAVPVVALLLSGCGAAAETQESQFDEGSAQAEIAALVDELSTAGARGQADTICTDILAQQLVDELNNAGGDCVDEMEDVISDAGDYDLQVTKVTVNGSNATATIRQGDEGDNTATFQFVKQREGWRASSFGGAS